MLLCVVFVTFSLPPPRSVELHVAGRQKKHRGSAGGLPRGSHPEDLQVPAAAEGECRPFQPRVVELPHPRATSAGPFLLYSGHHPAISPVRTGPFLARAPLLPTHLLCTCSAAPRRSVTTGGVFASPVQLHTQTRLFQNLLFEKLEVEK